MINFIPTVFWLTGLSGTGKTTLGTLLTENLRNENHPVVFLDGDILREIFGNRFGHDRQDRLEASLQYARVCKMLVEQNVHVVCATISLFHQTQEWNRHHIKNYIEIFVDTPMQELLNRDSKKIYSRGLSGELKNIVGIDIEAEIPKNPDLIIKNHQNTKVENNVAIILETYCQRMLFNNEVTHYVD